jgi:hypothetical protein
MAMMAAIVITELARMRNGMSRLRFGWEAYLRSGE